MAKRLHVLCVLLTALVLSGCGSTTSVTQTQSTTTETVYTSPAVVVEHHEAAKPGLNSSGTLLLNDECFASQITNRKGMALVDFGTTWCGGCKKLAPIVDELARELPNTTVAKVDFDDSPVTSNAYNIYQIPCLILFRDGREISRCTGYRPKEEVKAWIASQTSPHITDAGDKLSLEN